MLVFREDGIAFYGGGRSRGGGWQRWPQERYPDLAIGPDRELDVISRLPATWLCARTLPTFIELDWPDMRPPEVPPRFWAALAEDLKGADIETVQVQCLGGHGRTGTALAILLALLRPGEHESVDELVDSLRGMYCRHAVETASQLSYISDATGLPYEGRIGTRSFGGGGAYAPQQSLFSEATGKEEETDYWFGMEADGRIGVTGPEDLKILVECHAGDLGCTYLEDRDAGETIHTLILEGGEIEEFETLEEVADYLQLDGIYHY